MGAFRFLTAGESHGQMLVAVIEGVPASLPLTAEVIDRDLARRQHGYGRGGRMAIEQDRAQIVAGVRHGMTLGSPIALLVPNRDWPNWQERMDPAPGEAGEPVTRVRPGHADLAGALKYGHNDVRNVLERASARETASRVAAGAVARALLGEVGVSVRSYTTSIGACQTDARPEAEADWARVEASPLRCADASAEAAMVTAIDEARAAGDTLGGVFTVEATGVPLGLGSHVHWDRRLDGQLAQALMSIPSVKGVELGAGFAAAAAPGSRVHDLFAGPPTGAGRWPRATNHAGGVEGGISNGEPIVIR
ncbi:MAG: chorismate synthase, partial [Chloroflexota bacterium]